MELSSDKWNLIKILIADNDRLNFEYFRKLISRWGGVAFYAADGKELLDIYISDPDISVTLIDLRLCTIDCQILLKRLKKIRPDLRHVALSSYGPAYNKPLCLEWGFDEYISIPVLPGIFYRIVNNVILQNKSVDL